MQKKFRKGLIKEEDLSREKLKKLKELYKKQIDYIDDAIENDKKEILNFKRKLWD